MERKFCNVLKKPVLANSFVLNVFQIKKLKLSFNFTFKICVDAAFLFHEQKQHTKNIFKPHQFDLVSR